jgi:fatty-acyl-CoA synthase
VGEVAPPAGDADRLDLVLNGRPLPELEVEVRGPDGRPVPPGRTGAVWVRGASVVRGYHGAPPRAPGEWLETGDLGALVDGELVVFGRAKDLIIIRGRNHAPIDLEWAAQGAPGVRPGSAAAFAVDDPDEGTEGAVLACEVGEEETDWSRGAIAAQVQEVVLARTGLRLREVVLLPPGTVPKTTSGKVQRARARALFLEGRLR